MVDDLASLDLRTLEAVIARLSVEDRAELERLAAPELAKPFIPNPGAQTQALFSEADLLLYGGSGGSGKTSLEVGCAALDHSNGIIFRREATQLDGLIEFSHEVFARVDGANYNKVEKVWTWGDGRSLKLAGLAQPEDWRKHAGNARDYMAFDEGAEFLREQVFSLIGWLRTTRSNQRCRIILGTNPPRGPEGAWVIEEFAPWLDPLFPNPAKSGELRWAIVVRDVTEWVDGPGVYVRDGEEYEALSRTFIPARLDDNPYLRDTGYRAKLQALPEPLRSQLLHGDFLAGRQDDEWQVMPSAWVRAAQARWHEPKGPMRAIGIDVAQGGPDRTVLAFLHDDSVFGQLQVRDGAETPDGASVAGLAMKYRRDNAAIAVDTTGGWGGETRAHLETHNETKVHRIVFSSAAEGIDKDTGLAFANLRAKMYWELRNALNPESKETPIALPPGDKLAAELTASLWRPQSGKIQIESKEAIKVRLGVSPDLADAVVMAWHIRSQYAKQSKAKKLTPPKSRGGGNWMTR